MLHIDPKEKSVGEVFDYLLGGVAPRPIALVSTLSADGEPNLAPFSFFNAFGGNPPTVAFSPSRRRRDGTTKDTYHNLMATKECVIQVVTYEIHQQVNLASGEYEAGVDEFAKSGFTPVASDIVKPARVAESPFQMECKLKEIINLGDGPGSGNLCICEVVRFHIDERLFNDKGVIDPQLIDLVGRNSARFWTRAHGDAWPEWYRMGWPARLCAGIESADRKRPRSHGEFRRYPD
jgi:flavin reductase (DIM6/NTAB) family NADH-FMN oxidoreductase RutF